jgi:hypothetical protein
MRKTAQADRAFRRGSVTPLKRSVNERELSQRVSPRSGVALIVTLIMLSIITVMAVAFLALSRRERSAVVHSQNSIDAELSASAAAERAKAEILANIITYSNYTGPGLLVSGARTNIIESPLDIPGYGNPRDRTDDDKDLNAITNLWRDGLPPVFVTTRTNTQDQRFYLDLNRNGLYDTNGALKERELRQQLLVEVTNLYVGDPEWFGILSRPSEPHSKDNRFIGRYAFIALPVGTSLDFNYIHNDAKDISSPDSRYNRNQGVGCWEINLAAFLTDLNANQWNLPGQGYQYSSNIFAPSRGMAFLDAQEILFYRYNGSRANLDFATAMFGQNVLPIFASDGIDALCNSPFAPLGARTLATVAADGDNAATNWPGALSKRHLFSIHDLFDNRKLTNTDNFISHLTNASVSVDRKGPTSYDRYTFYRMLSQIGTDSVPEGTNKININYNNINGNSVTNFVQWRPLEFFTNVAHRILRDEFPVMREQFGTNVELYATIYTNLLQRRIPVMINGMTQFTNAFNLVQRIYSPHIHQILQVSANVYEATLGGKLDEKEPYFPTVFRPVFHLDPGTTNIFIVDFVDETGPGMYNRVVQRTGPAMRWHTLDDSSTWPGKGPAPTTGGDFDTNDFFYGVPFIVGAKKGFPNFNELAIQTVANFSRKLEFRKDAPSDSTPKQTNQMFIVGVSNAVAAEAWNSYDRPYPRNLRMVCGNTMGLTLTNDASPPLVYSPQSLTNNGGIQGTNYFIKAGDWGAQQFRVPLIGAGLVLTDSVYRLTPQPHLEPISATNFFENAGAAYTNRWGLTLTNKLLFFVFDDEYKYLVDAVSIANQSHVDISGVLNQTEGSPVKDQFLTQPSPSGGVSLGIKNQIEVSLGSADAGTDWIPYSQLVGDKAGAIAAFTSFMFSGVVTNGTNMQAPFTPIARIVQTTRWEANDPLVHYYPGDLETLDEAGNPMPIITQPRRSYLNERLSVTNDTTIGSINSRYRPWGHGRGLDPSSTHPGMKDAGIWSSANWDFPMQKFPSIGWLGRVHRGTPWQTIYLKGGVVPREDWLEHRSVAVEGGPGNSMETHPTNDWRLVDYFTTALHPNATKGTLSVNQTNLAAWSAVLCGAMATKLYTPKPDEPERADHLIQPAALEPAVLQIFEGICRERDKKTNLFSSIGRFERLSDILSVPELTTASPFLKPPYSDDRVDPADYLFDIDYERIPDQILSLLKLGEPRFVIYAFGQSLKPEYIDPSSGVALNYQITGEVATRSLVRVEFEPKSTNPQDSDYLKPNVFKPHIVVEQFNILPPE